MKLDLKKFIARIVLGMIGWSIIFSVGYSNLTIYIPHIPSSLEQYGSDISAWIGAIIGWMVLCILLGIPLLMILQRWKRFKKLVS